MSVPGSNIDLDRDRMTAALDLIGRTGAVASELRYSDDHPPTVWMAVVEYAGDDGEARYEAAAALHPNAALDRLLEVLIDGGRCAHCGKPSAVDADWQHPIRAVDQTGREVFCFYVYDPELKTYRRSCEGD